MGNLKWEDVAHMYSKSVFSIKVGDKLHGVKNMTSCGTVVTDELPCYGMGNVHYPDAVKIGGYTPILRHLEDMTEVEMVALYKNRFGEVGGFEDQHAFDWSRIVIGGGVFYPEEFVKIIEWGFDMFKLIESGQAIRKES